MGILNSVRNGGKTISESNLDTLGRRWHHVSYYHHQSQSIASSSMWKDDSLAHTQHPINLLDTEPVKNIGHQGLKSHIFDPSNILRSLEVLRSTIQATLSSVVDKVLKQEIRRVEPLGRTTKHWVNRVGFEWGSGIF